jgi:anti-anti-sigma regulatory factor
MAMIALQHKIDGERVAPALQEAREKLDGSEQEMFLDFSSVSRLDASSLRAMEELAAAAENKAVRIVLRGASIELYKVLKLMKLAARFAFVN